MANNQNQKQKLLNLCKILFEYTDELHPLNANQIMDMLREKGIDCERKSVYRDIECLNNFGFEIMQSTIPHGYYFGERLFEMPELRMLIDSVKSSEFITEKKTVELIEKLKKMTSIYLADELNSTGCMQNRPKNRNEGIYYNIDKLHSAIKTNKKVHFSYYRYSIYQGRPVSRKSHEFTVSPYALIWNDGKYYLVANYDKYDDLSHYRVDRMKKVDILVNDVRPLHEVSDFTDEFDEAEYISRVFGMYAGSRSKSIELKCSVSSLELIIEKFGYDVGFNPIDDNYFTVCINAAINDGLVSWILSQRGKVSAVYPPELVRNVADVLSNMLEEYNYTE